MRLSLLSACVWWAGFTLIPFLRLKDVEPQPRCGSRAVWCAAASGSSGPRSKELRGYPMTLTFLIAYLFYNDGIQTVIFAASTFGTKTLGFSSSVLIATILVIQFVAFGGALLFGRLAERHGAYKIILAGTFVWMAIVVVAIFLPRRNVALFLLVAVAIGVVLGGTQALSRSFFSLLIPRGREGEYFALYNACERGTSWLGTLVFGVVFQLTGSYRPAILALIVFFAVGTVFLLRLDPARGIREAGNRVPQLSADPPPGRIPTHTRAAPAASLDEAGGLPRAGTVECNQRMEVLPWQSEHCAARGWAARVSRTSAASSSRRASRSATAAHRVTTSRSRCRSRPTSRRCGSAHAAAPRR